MGKPADSDRPLVPLLIGLTLVTGLVDAASYLLLGRVFVANMTGNVLFVGFALAALRAFRFRLYCWLLPRSVLAPSAVDG